MMAVGRLSNTKQNPILCLFSIEKCHFIPIFCTKYSYFLRGTCHLTPCNWFWYTYSNSLVLKWILMVNQNEDLVMFYARLKHIEFCRRGITLPNLSGCQSWSQISNCSVRNIRWLITLTYADKSSIINEAMDSLSRCRYALPKEQFLWFLQ